MKYSMSRRMPDTQISPPAVIAEGKDVTYDMKADRNDRTAVGTQQMAEAICRKMKSL